MPLRDMRALGQPPSFVCRRHLGRQCRIGSTATRRSGRGGSDQEYQGHLGRPLIGTYPGVDAPLATAGMLLAPIQWSSVRFRPTTRDDREQKTLIMGSTRYLTLFDVIQAVREVAANDQETLVTVAGLINSGQVRLCGDAMGPRLMYRPRKNSWPEAGKRHAACGWRGMDRTSLRHSRAS